MYMTWRSNIESNLKRTLSLNTVEYYNYIYKNVIDKIEDLKSFHLYMSEPNNNFAFRMLNTLNTIEKIMNHITSTNETEGQTISEEITNKANEILIKISDKSFSINDHIKKSLCGQLSYQSTMTNICAHVYLTTNFVKHIIHTE